MLLLFPSSANAINWCRMEWSRYILRGRTATLLLTALILPPLSLLGQEKCEPPAELKAAQSGQTAARAFNAAGAYFAERKEIDCATAAFESALRLDATFWEARYNLGLALKAGGQLDRAVTELRQ